MLRREAQVKARARRIWLPRGRNRDAQHLAMCPSLTEEGVTLGISVDSRAGKTPEEAILPRS